MESAYLLTGASGFLGKELFQKISIGAEVKTLSRSAESDISCDLGDAIPQLSGVFDVVVHNAGKAHIVPCNTEDAEDFFRVNYHGTLNLLKAIEQSGNLPKAFVFISTVAVYGVENGKLLNEQIPLNATSPYGMSKKMAEEAVLKWGVANNVKTSILRLPLVAGARAPGNLKKMLKAQRAGYYFQIGGGKARKSMVAATDVAKVIPEVASIGGVYNLTDQYHPSFDELSSLFAEKLKIKRPLNLPIWLARPLAWIGDGLSLLLRKSTPFNSNAFLKMTNSLTFSDKKAQELLGWKPQPVLTFYRDLPQEELIHD